MYPDKSPAQVQEWVDAILQYSRNVSRLWLLHWFWPHYPPVPTKDTGRNGQSHSWQGDRATISAFSGGEVVLDGLAGAYAPTTGAHAFYGSGHASKAADHAIAYHEVMQYQPYQSFGRWSDSFAYQFRNAVQKKCDTFTAADEQFLFHSYYPFDSEHHADLISPAQVLMKKQQLARFDALTKPLRDALNAPHQPRHHQ